MNGMTKTTYDMKKQFNFLREDWYFVIIFLIVLYFVYNNYNKDKGTF